MAATAPSKGAKTMVFEGGIRCPCLVRYPGFGAPAGGAVSHAFTTVMDILPTILDLAGVSHPGTVFRGRDVVVPRGKSWKPHLNSFKSTQLTINLDESSVHAEDAHIHGWELFGERGIREGPWKAIWIPPPRGPASWQLFHIKNDPAEMHDLSKSEGVRLERMVKHWETYCAETGLVEFSGPWFPPGV